jgi:hypothetical protein
MYSAQLLIGKSLSIMDNPIFKRKSNKNGISQLLNVYFVLIMVLGLCCVEGNPSTQMPLSALAADSMNGKDNNNNNSKITTKTSATPSCSDVQSIFEVRGITQNEIPKNFMNGKFYIKI